MIVPYGETANLRESVRNARNYVDRPLMFSVNLLYLVAKHVFREAGWQIIPLKTITNGQHFTKG